MSNLSIFEGYLDVTAEATIPHMWVRIFHLNRGTLDVTRIPKSGLQIRKSSLAISLVLDVVYIYSAAPLYSFSLFASELLAQSVGF